MEDISFFGTYKKLLGFMALASRLLASRWGEDKTIHVLVQVIQNMYMHA